MFPRTWKTIFWKHVIDEVSIPASPHFDNDDESGTKFTLECKTFIQRSFYSFSIEISPFIAKPVLKHYSFRCCKVCAKTVGETCGVFNSLSAINFHCLIIFFIVWLNSGGLGGFSGMCETPLKCISKPPIIGTGVCLGECVRFNFHVR